MIALVQRALQAAFMAVEARFNAFFGDRLNPFYHLGAISFFLFWIVAGSGVYLYAFFGTGVADAYLSVQALTHRQWYVGGVLRSIHRYASDAFVLTMLLHLVRHFAFDRFSGFRAFSWLTGLMLLWLVYVAGVNGYMLPWDRLAQFVIVTSFEWLDWLPGLGGTLIRNVMYPSSINDRFFSLLAFMHIGISLLVLLLMWVHVQRVPKAKTAPPRPIIVGLLLALLVLAMFAPVVSQQGPAALERAVANVDLDWFLLPLLPLIERLPARYVWTLVIGSSVLLAVLPWLRRRPVRAGAGPVHLRIAGSTRKIAVRPGETLLDAGLREGLALPFECRNGGCGVCVCTVLDGRVDHGLYQERVLPAAARNSGRALLCCATPLTDVEIELDDTATLQVPAASGVYSAHVEAMELLAPEVMRLLLATTDGRSVPFKAGQYINILLDDGQRRAFSFANPPQRADVIELHVRRIPGGRFTGHVFDQMKVGDSLRFEGPLGSFTLSESDAPILMVAGATGFAPVKSILEDAFLRGIQRPMWLYWGVRQPSDFYLLDVVQDWERQHANFHFSPVVSEPVAADQWAGRIGLVHEAMLADFPSLAGYELYVCGSVRMVDAAVPEFLAHGLSADACFSDAFVPARAALSGAEHVTRPPARP